MENLQINLSKVIDAVINTAFYSYIISHYDSPEFETGYRVPKSPETTKLYYDEEARNNIYTVINAVFDHFLDESKLSGTTFGKDLHKALDEQFLQRERQLKATGKYIFPPSQSGSNFQIPATTAIYMMLQSAMTAYICDSAYSGTPIFINENSFAAVILCGLNSMLLEGKNGLFATQKGPLSYQNIFHTLLDRFKLYDTFEYSIWFIYNTLSNSLTDQKELFRSSPQQFFNNIIKKYAEKEGKNA